MQYSVAQYGKLLLIIGVTGFLATGIETWTTIAPALLGVIAVAVTSGPLRTSSETVAAVAETLIALLALFGPHRVRSFKLSTDPQFAARLRDIVGLTSIRRRMPWCSRSTRSRRLQRRPDQPGLPMKKGRRRHHDPRLQAQRHDDAVRRARRAGGQGDRPLHAAPPASGVHPLSQRIEAAVPVGKVVHVILDNYGAHKHAKVSAWLDRHPRFVFHFTPTSASWLNAVEGFFAKLDQAPPETRRVPLARRPAGRHQPLPRRNQRQPQTLRLDRRPRPIIAAVKRGHQALNSIH